MAVADLLAGEITTELLRQLFSIAQKSSLCKDSAEGLISHVNELFPIFQEIKKTGVELPQFRQFQLDRLSKLLLEGRDLAEEILTSKRWNVYRNIQLSRKMEKLEKKVAAFVQGPLQAHLLADVHHLRFDTAERFDRLEESARRIEHRLVAVQVGAPIWLEDEIKRMEELGQKSEANLGNIGAALQLGLKKVKQVLKGKEDGVVGVCGIGGIGKTTLAKQICKDDDVKSYFENKILFLTVSQSPNMEALRTRIWGFLSGTEFIGAPGSIPPWSLQREWKLGIRKLVVLDDVWSLSVLEQLVFRVPGCRTLVISRFKFPTVFNLTYEVELLKDDEALGLFCLSAFGQKTIPFSANENLVKQADISLNKLLPSSSATMTNPTQTTPNNPSNHTCTSNGPNRSPSEIAMAQALHVASIKTHVPVVLDLKESNYNKWRALFLVTLGKFALLPHISDEQPENPNDPEWKILDFTVTSWIYGSIHPNIFDMVIKDGVSSKELWKSIENLFRDNKKSPAINLETEFRSLLQGSMNISDYCQRLKTLADGLTDVDSPVSDETLVLQTIRGLNNDFQTMAAIIPMQRPFPTFQECRGILLLEESRRANNSTSETALAAVVPPSPSPAPAAPAPPANNPPQQHNNNRGRSRFRGRGRGRFGGGRGWANWQQQQQWQWPPQQQTWNQNQHPWNAGILGAAPRQNNNQAQQQAMVSEWDQNRLFNAFNSSSLQQPPEGWYMDTGASSHMTSNAGTPNQERDSQMQ